MCMSYIVEGKPEKEWKHTFVKKKGRKEVFVTSIVEGQRRVIRQEVTRDIH